MLHAGNHQCKHNLIKIKAVLPDRCISFFCVLALILSSLISLLSNHAVQHTWNTPNVENKIEIEEADHQLHDTASQVQGRKHFLGAWAQPLIYPNLFLDTQDMKGGVMKLLPYQYLFPANTQPRHLFTPVPSVVKLVWPKLHCKSIFHS